MKLNVQNTSLFKKRAAALGKQEQEKLNHHVQKLADSYKNGMAFFNKNVSQPYQFKLKNNLESSLYSAKVSPNLRLILSVDEDPLFNQLAITLFDITDKEKEVNTFKKIGERIYLSENLLDNGAD